MALALYKGDCQVNLLQFVNGSLVNASKNMGFDYESFIESVRPHPYLYDRNSPGFKDKVMKENRWSLIAASNGITTAQARKKWRNLRDKYHRLTKKMFKIQKDLDLSNIPKTKWYYYNTMDTVLRATFETQFCITNPRPAAQDPLPEDAAPPSPPEDVKPQIKHVEVQQQHSPSHVTDTPPVTPPAAPKTTTSTSHHASTSANGVISVNTTKVSNPSQQPSTSNNNNHQQIAAPLPPPPPPPKIVSVCQAAVLANCLPAAPRVLKRKQPDPEILKWIRNTEMSLGSAAKQPCLEDRDTTYYFCMALAERLRGLSRFNCLRAMNDIQNCVYKIEIEEYSNK